ncbi:MAG: hypothetical protein HY820_40060 [Acidobacteria bacterium]|nr:hypothetical protein [Acidobacteriota bacterium]
MHNLYWYLLSLLPPSFRRPFEASGASIQIDEEMYGIHLAIAADARAQGRLPYLLFCIRELAGLIAEAFTQRTFLPRRVLWLPSGALLGLIAACLIVLAVGPETFTSTATLQWTQPLLLRQTVPPRRPAPVEVIERARGDELYTSLIATHNLYPRERETLPADALIRRMRSNLTVEGYTIRFRYTNRDKAQAVVQNVVNHILKTQTDLAGDALASTVDALGARRAQAKTVWANVRATRQPQREIDAARAQLETMTRDYFQALLQQRALRADPAGLDSLDPATLPVRPDISHIEIYGYGFLIGSLAGLLVSLIGPYATRSPALAKGGRA